MGNFDEHYAERSANSLDLPPLQKTNKQSIPPSSNLRKIEERDFPPEPPRYPLLDSRDKTTLDAILSTNGGPARTPSRDTLCLDALLLSNERAVSTSSRVSSWSGMGDPDVLARYWASHSEAFDSIAPEAGTRHKRQRLSFRATSSKDLRRKEAPCETRAPALDLKVSNRVTKRVMTKVARCWGLSSETRPKEEKTMNVMRVPTTGQRKTRFDVP